MEGGKKGSAVLISKRIYPFCPVHRIGICDGGGIILVNTITLVKGGLQLTDRDYGLIMTAFGVGVTIAAFVSGVVDRSRSRRVSLLLGALVLALAISAANYLSFSTLFIFWIIADLGQRPYVEYRQGIYGRAAIYSQWKSKGV